MSHQEYAAIDESVDVDTESCPTTDDDSEHQDPSFDLLEETRSRFSNLSVKKKSASRSRIAKKMDEGMEEEDSIAEDVIVPELDEKDKKSFEIVQKIIEVGQVEKLKVEQCKVYLRKHGLRLTGKKDILLQRIREHLSIMNGEGEKKYPASSFVMNCKGDACTGDVVMFEQNVYEMFNIASRSASGPPCGTRLVVGRIVKESYGAAKQQHTFTIEVLWSKGEKPLPPLHPLLIKGRNLYKLKTMRQRWEDEGARQKILFEKHTRGSLARSSREARIQEKEMRKTLRENRALRTKDQNGNLEANKIKASLAPLLKPGFLLRQPNVEQVSQKTVQEQICQQTKLLRPCNESSSVPTGSQQRVPTALPPTGINYKENNISSNLSKGLLKLPVDSQRQQFNPSTCAFRRAPLDEQSTNIPRSSFGGPIGQQQMTFNAPKSPLRMSSQDQQQRTNPKSPLRMSSQYQQQRTNPKSPLRMSSQYQQQRTNVNYMGSQFQGWYGQEGRASSKNFQSLLPRLNFQERNNNVGTSYRFQGQGHEQKQLCKYYPQGRCYYGDHCKYLH